MSYKPGILFMPHGNLQYSQLKPENIMASQIAAIQDELMEMSYFEEK